MRKLASIIRSNIGNIIASIVFIVLVIGTLWVEREIYSEEETTQADRTIQVTTAVVEENTTVNVEAPVPTEPETIIKTTIRYDVPLDDSLQKYVIDMCNKRGVAPSLVFAIMGRESNFNPNCVGDSGDSLGIMQIQPKWHQWRADKLGCLDWFNPYDNATVGIDIIAGLFEKYGDDVYMVLMAYNGGSSYANRMSSKGVVSDYAIKVNVRAEELDKTMQVIEETIILD